MTIAPLIAALMLVPGQMVDAILTDTNAQETLEAVRSPEPSPQPEPTQSPTPEPVAAPEPKPEPSQSKRWGIPVHVVMCESGGDYTAQNPHSTAGGAYQMIQSTADYVAESIGHPELIGVPAHRWPPHLQDQGAAFLWDDGRGKNHWRACL